MIAQEVENIDKIVAKVDNYIILKSEIELGYFQMLSNGSVPNTPNPRCEILRQLIVNKMLVAKADIDSITVESEVVQGELDRRMKVFIAQAGDEDKLEASIGKSISKLKDELRDQVREQMVIQKIQSEITSDLKVTPAQVKKYFSKIPKDSIPFLSAEVEVGQIVKMPEVSKEENEKVKNQLINLKGKIESGEDFGELAKKYSEDYGSAVQGGNLGWHGRGELVPEFEATALKLKVGQVADPVKSDFGYHLIQLLERRGNRFNARHILIRPKATDSDLKRTISFMDSIRTMVLRDSMTFESAAAEHSDDKETRANAGYFKDQATGSSVILVDYLDPNVYFIIDTMKTGNISAPMKFRMEDGKNAVRLVYYKSYISPHYADLKTDYQKIAVAALNSQKQERLDKWLKEAQEEVYIDIDPEYDKCDLLDKL